MSEHLVTTIDDLTALYDDVHDIAIAKEQSFLHPVYRQIIEASPFCALATVGPDGTDCTPRGDGPGFIRVVDEHTLEMPDRKGNNRLDSLRNIVEDGRVSLLFLIPTRIDTMRVNGRAVITTDPETLASHAIDGKAPACVVRITVDAAYLQCGKAMIRSKLWEPEAWASTDGLPTAGQVFGSFEGVELDISEFDQAYEPALRDSLT